MIKKPTTIEDIFSPLRTYFQDKSFSRKSVDEKPPLRSEIFTRDQMDAHAASLARIHKLSYAEVPEQLLKRLSENEELLTRVTQLLHDAVKDKQRISPAGEWLLDNFYLIEEQIVTGKKYLPKGYSKGLPKLLNANAAGLPRVYNIAIEIISHSDGHVDIKSLSNFIAAYQRHSHLTIGELWAVPIMLRLALLENLSRVAAKIAIDRIDENLAIEWADKLLATAAKNANDLVLVIADMVRSKPPLESAFVAPFTQKLQWKGAEMVVPISWLEQQLAERGSSISQMTTIENQQQAANQVSMSNSINSLRFLAKMDWREFVETMSVTEQTLRTDPAGIYSKMDFFTRDSYRHAVEKIAKKWHVQETEVASIAITLATDYAPDADNNNRKKHVGYWLIGPGSCVTENRVKQKVKGRSFPVRPPWRYHAGFYKLTTLFITLGLTALFYFKALIQSDYSIAVWILLLVIFALASSQFALQIANWLATIFVKPKPLPRMNYSTGIPPESRTLVVVPCMLVNETQAKTLLEELEVRFLANQDANLHFALLTDFTDAKQERLPEDDVLLKIVADGIQDLNARYGQTTQHFFLFHRKRIWNAKENSWMGWERKRGKLEDLNKLLRGHRSGHYDLVIADEQIFPGIKYVITLDADTQLPREAAWKLAGIMSHPLNRPVIHPKKNLVVEGYGIIQPRIAISLHGTVRSKYTLMHENDAGIDPYTRVTSNVYQDLFDEGSFIGKGIYDIDVFETVLGDRFPDNKILSHDLLEGAYARCAFASDVQLYEDYPSRYRVDMNRRHRWIRGDWQIANWILPFVPNHQNRLSKNPISALSAWKIFDNLRRSLVPLALLILLILGWTILQAPVFWTLVVIGIGLLPSFIASARDILNKPDDVEMKYHIRNSANAIYRNIAEAVFYLICLPYEAFISADAITRSTWRMLFSRRKLLEWNPFGFDQKSQYKNLGGVYLSMWPAIVIAVAVFVLLSIYYPWSLPLAMPFLIAWLLSPAIVWWLGHPLKDEAAALSAKQVTNLRKLSRRTWSFYENFVGPEDNWLPPDNFQQHPVMVLAHRTSPTNIGLALMANLAAYDFGYIPLTGLEERCRHTISAMQKLERYAGHLYNWYDTVSLQPLYPRYISVVDSGNLGGHLLTLKQGLLGTINDPLFGNKHLQGLADTLAIICEECSSNLLPAFETLYDELKEKTKDEQQDLVVFSNIIQQFSEKYNDAFNNLDDTEKTKLYWWSEALVKQINDLQADLLFFAPWLELPVHNNADLPAWFTQIPTLASFSQVTQAPDGLENSDDSSRSLQQKWLLAREHAAEYIHQLQELMDSCEEFANMEYEFLYDKSQHLFVIGYNVEEHKRDSACYDLLASEARLASFLAIAQGKIPQENWFALGRRLTNTAGSTVLLSWSGSMFEYLMPNLVMPSYSNTLLDRSNRGAVKKQIEYGNQMGTPWGISESCYNVVDAHLNYQYRAFGVPGLGFKRGLGEDHVIAPYASVMSLMIDPTASYDNIERMIAKGYQGKYGLYESVDFTAARLPRGHNHVVIQTFMVHHLGMSLLALLYTLLDKPMQKRFEAEPRFQATLLLLQEQVPRLSNFYSSIADTADVTVTAGVAEMRVIKTPNTPVPEVQLLSNGVYHAMLTNSGAGYSRWKDKAVTRWREDITMDAWGTFCYIRDLGNNNYWSNTYQPTLVQAKFYEAVFSQGRAEFKRLDNGIETHTEVIVSPEDDIEIRRITLTNRSGKKRKIEVTTYAEVVMNQAAADASHPAFSNLFVQTEILESHHAIVCTRRPRSAEEHQPYMFHQVKLRHKKEHTLSFETDRSKFIGRGNSLQQPLALQQVSTLSNTMGPVLDPIVSVRYSFELDQEETFSFDVLMGMTETKEDCQQLLDKYQDRQMRDRAFELSWTHSQVILRQINASESDAQLFGKMAGAVIYANPYWRADPSIISRNRRGQSGLWSYSISGDIPIVLLQVSSTENMSLVKQMIQARTYWQMKGMAVDLFIWNEDESGYLQVLQEQIENIISANTNFNSGTKMGGIFVRPADQISIEDKILLQTVARVIISDKKGTLADQLNKKIPALTNIPHLNMLPATIAASGSLSLPDDLSFFNGYGGFAAEGHEYIIDTGSRSTPAPWVNIIANKNMGFVISERGSSYTWYENAHSYRLSPWANDSIIDPSGEAFYIRDEKTGQFWSPTPYPAKGKGAYITKHGFGYTVFEHTETGIESDMEVLMDTEAPVKYFIINLRNQSGVDRKLSVTGYIQWVLGDLASKTSMHVITEADIASGAVYAGNAYSSGFESRVCFFACNENTKNFTGNRTEFIGRNGTLARPDAMTRTRLSGKTGAALDSCAAIMNVFDLPAGESKQLVFILGSANNNYEARTLVEKYSNTSVAQEALQAVHDLWKTLLRPLQVYTPDAAFNTLANGWLLYQTIACRLWARSGFYQSGGAFGFRDQLQDVLATFHADPTLARAQILLAASRQFKEGDVQHWWHPPQGRGVRTHCSDDYLWLPYVTARYVQHTGDTGILQESIGFLQGRLVNPNEESYYDLPERSAETATLYQHCKLALEHGFRYGVHGLPLIGAGDWNDGMNMVGKEGKGESVWLGFFLYEVINQFTPVAQAQNDIAFVERITREAATLKTNINKNAWDGNWYLRAFFDDGTPIGSHNNIECKIDSISQSWSVISGAGEEDRKHTAMASLKEHLVRPDAGIIQLLDPPFDKSPIDPGYIKGYLPGVRENGGQYTHAAIWTVMAFAKMKEQDTAWNLLSMINPLNHGKTEESISTYKVEPYVMAADVYGVPPHTGRGGWTWYTGSAGWFYQLMTEWFIGIKVKNNKELYFEPCLPEEWSSVKVIYQHAGTVYNIELKRGNPADNQPITLEENAGEKELVYYF